MKLRQFQIDAFADRAFTGNPAAVCPLPEWPEDALLQAIAEENNLSETAFFVASARGYRLRWFTPASEVDLCGHATLAAAHVLFERLGQPGEAIVFETRSGELVARRVGAAIELDFPATLPQPCAVPEALVAGLGARPGAVLAGEDYVAVFDSEAAVRALVPDHAHLVRLDRRGVIVTAPGTEFDFVSRFFAPKVGVNEDPVTGSAHCQLAPYWAGRLGRSSLRARQVSRRGGNIDCRLAGGRVFLTGSAVTVIESDLLVASWPRRE